MSKEINLTRGYKTIVDDEDYDRLNNGYTWRANKRNGISFAAQTSITVGRGKQKGVEMQRLIMEPMTGMVVVHKNGDTLDNRKTNLEIISLGEKQIRSKKKYGGASIYKGVYKSNGKWRVKIFLGDFNSEKEAGRAYDSAVKKIYDTPAYLNFPEERRITPAACRVKDVKFRKAYATRAAAKLPANNKK